MLMRRIEEQIKSPHEIFRFSGRDRLKDFSQGGLHKLQRLFQVFYVLITKSRFRFIKNDRSMKARRRKRSLRVYADKGESCHVISISREFLISEFLIWDKVS